MSIWRWIKNDPEEDKVEGKIIKLQETLESNKSKFENPHNKEYHDKLNELLQSEADSRDNFINWLTGLATGIMFYIFAKDFGTKEYTRILLLIAGGLLFATIISALLFKIFLRVRYSDLRVQVSLLHFLWEGHDLRSKIKAEISQGNKIDRKTKEEFMENYRSVLNFADPAYREKLKRPVMIQSHLLSFFYWATLFLFFLSVSATGVFLLIRVVSF